MRRVWSVLLALALALSLAACGKTDGEPFDPETTAQRLVEAPKVFSEELERLDTAIALAQYNLGKYLDVEVTAYRSTGATAEEVAVIRFGDRADAEGYESVAEAYLAEQKEANVDYRPQEMPKLEQAVIERRDNTVLILVAADVAAAQPILG